MHFSVLILTNESEQHQAEHKAVDMLAPFDENLLVEEHIVDCYCIGAEARSEARRAAIEEARHLGIDDLKEQLSSLTKEICLATGGEASPWQKAEDVLTMIVDPGLREDYRTQIAVVHSQIKEIQQATDYYWEQVEREHPDYGKADPDCEVCQGTGIYFSTENPQGRWDWWQVGGRWSGLLVKDYDPAADHRNYQDCEWCGQTGVRWWEEANEDGMPQPAGHPSFDGEEAPYGVEVRTCNSCEGTGIARRFGNAPFQGDITPADQIDDLDGLGKALAALIDPKGKWHSSDDHSDLEWQQLLESMLAGQESDMAVLVDCHW